MGEVIVRSMLIMRVSGSLVLGECEKSFYRQHGALQGIGICVCFGMLAKPAYDGLIFQKEWKSEETPRLVFI